MTRPLAATVALALVAALPARAYVPDAPTILHRFAERASHLKTKVQPLTAQADVTGQGTIPAEVKLSAGECRIVLDGVLPYAATYHAGRTTLEGSGPPSLEALASFACPLALLAGATTKEAEANANRLATRLHVDLATVSLERLDGRVALVVGARPRDFSKPQLWFDQRTALPLRVIGTVSGQLWDVRFEDPASLATGHAAPRRIAVYQGGQRALLLTVMLAEPASSAPPGSVGDGDDRPDE